MRAKRLLWWGLGPLLALLVLASAGLGVLVHTPEGLQWLYRQARELAPGTLEIRQLEGRLSGPLAIHGLEYAQGELRLQLDLLRLDWRPSALLKGGLVVSSLEAQGIRLQLPESGDDAPAAPFPGMVLPLRLELESARVVALTIANAGSEPLVLDRIVLVASGAGERVGIRRLEAAGLGAELALQGELRLAAGLPMDLGLEWRYQLPDAPQLAGSGTLQGDLERLNLRQVLQGPVAGTLEGVLESLEQAPRWDLRLQLEHGEVAAFAPNFPAVVTGNLHSAGTPQGLGLDASLSLEEPVLGRIDASLDGGYDGTTLAVRRLGLETPTGTRIDASGGWRPQDGGLEARLSWSALRWPLRGETVQVRSGKGHLTVQGRPTDYSYALGLALAAPDVPPLELTAKGGGDLEGLQLQPLEAELLEGRLEGSGRVNWAPQVSWDLALKGAGLNPQQVLAQLPGRLELAAATRGQLADHGPQAEVTLERLQGQLRDYPVQATGQIRVHGQALTLQGVAVSSGDNRLSASGTLGDAWDLQWKLDAGGLDGLWPGLSGRLAADGRLGGDPARPEIQARIEGQGLAYQAHRVERLEGDLALDRGERIALDLQATGLASGGLHWNRLGLRSQGRRSAHTLQLNLTGEQTAPSVELALSGALVEDGSWRGRIDALALEQADARRWRLRRATDLTVGEQRLALADACLDGPHAALCLEAAGNPGGAWDGHVYSERLSLELLRPWLPQDVKVDGDGRLDIRLKVDAAGRSSGEALLELPEARAVVALGDVAQTLDLGGTRVQSTLDAKGGNAKLDLPLGGLGAMAAEVGLPGLEPAALDPTSQAIQGRVQANIDDLALISTLVPAISEVQGGIQADFRLAGTLAQPQVKGEAKLAEGALDVPQLGLQVRELTARVWAPELQRLSYEAQARSGDGSLAVEGETRLEPDQGWPTQLHIRGKQWVAADVPEATLWLTPDLTLRHEQAATYLDGELSIPYARLRPRELPASAASDSSDLVVVSGGDTVEQDDAKLHTRIRLVLGDRVSFEGFGLRGRFTGTLELIDEPGRPVLGNGALNIEEGTYKAYGQDLKIERGSALFADSPVDNPGLDLRAVRKAGEVTAGIRVGGTLKKPEVSLFSSPAMTQGETLSYLLTGKAPGEGGEGGSATAVLAGAAAGQLSGEVGRQLGLEELRLETGGNLADASLVAGTWLSPRLYVQYVNELATRETKLRLQYDINKRLQIQTESGSAQGVDLFYTIER